MAIDVIWHWFTNHNEILLICVVYIYSRSLSWEWKHGLASIPSCVAVASKASVAKYLYCNGSATKPLKPQRFWGPANLLITSLNKYRKSLENGGWKFTGVTKQVKSGMQCLIEKEGGGGTIGIADDHLVSILRKQGNLIYSIWSGQVYPMGTDQDFGQMDPQILGELGYHISLKSTSMSTSIVKANKANIQPIITASIFVAELQWKCNWWPRWAGLEPAPTPVCSSNLKAAANFYQAKIQTWLKLSTPKLKVEVNSPKQKKLYKSILCLYTLYHYWSIYIYIASAPKLANVWAVNLQTSGAGLPSWPPRWPRGWDPDMPAVGIAVGRSQK